MNAVKTSDELVMMREGGQKLGRILEQLLNLAIPGGNLLHIESEAQRLIKEAGGTPSFQTVAGYEWATCLCINEAVVHGVPKDYILKAGDVLTIDVGILYKGFHTDTAWTKLIQNSNPPAGGQNYEEKEKFLKIGEEALWKAIAQVKAGNRVGHISKVIQEAIEGAGYGIVRTLVGHGVGIELHEAPQIPGYLRIPIEETLELLAGMTIAVEIIYAMGSGAVEYPNDDGWTIATKDRSLSAVFEHTVAITAGEPELLTKTAN
ncbi:type I methionyl aminopeptidase [Candidatus Gottesmanbacteria bacterium]|nr:type I methionyl aminopeptidase [Candidatus Gottesmanbacteria bacterium]